MKVSIIIPCYNVERYIADCIRSCENQSYSDLEVICVNDGSSDETEEIIKRIIETSETEISLISVSNNGAPRARNIGLENSSGNYIQFLDADDLVLPGKIEEQIKIAKTHDYPDLIVGGYRRESMLGEILAEKTYSSIDQGIWTKLMRTDLGITSSNLFKTDLFKENEIKWNESLKSSQEYELMFQLLKCDATVVFDPHINTIIRERDAGSITQTNLDKKWERYVSLRLEILEYLKESRPHEINEEIMQSLFGSIRMLYQYNPSLAFSYYKKVIPRDFSPKISQVNGKSYVRIYSLFGFKAAEEIRRRLSRVKAK